MSLTIQGLLAMLVGFLANHYELDLDEGSISEIVTAILTVGGFLVTWYGRVRHGDINWLGLRK